MTRDVTLITFEGVRSRWATSEALHKRMREFGDFGEAHFIGADCTYDEAMRWEVGRLSDFLKTSHALICTWDGFIANPHLWDDGWLEYDMIGAPWPAFWHTGHRVGNTGFSLQSKWFLETARVLGVHYQGGPGDVWLCRTMHDRFVDRGIKYAPVDVASRFSWEHNTEEGIAGPLSSFGFHGWVAGKQPQHYYR